MGDRLGILGVVGFFSLSLVSVDVLSKLVRVPKCLGTLTNFAKKSPDCRIIIRHLGKEGERKFTRISKIRDAGKKSADCRDISQLSAKKRGRKSPPSLFPCPQNSNFFDLGPASSKI